MKLLLVCFVLLSVGCADMGDSSAASRDPSGETVDNPEIDVAGINPERQILSSLKSTNRNTVHVVLWTLQDNDIEIPAEIDFDSPYKDIVNRLDSLADRLAKLDNSKLNALDESLEHHWQIYSPIWGPASENWD